MPSVIPTVASKIGFRPIEAMSAVRDVVTLFDTPSPFHGAGAAKSTLIMAHNCREQILCDR
jgi:hypothetical protein